MVQRTFFAYFHALITVFSKIKKHTSEREKLFRQRIAALWSIARARFLLLFFLLTVPLLQRVRGGRINEIKRSVQELGVEEGRGLIFGRIRYA